MTQPGESADAWRPLYVSSVIGGSTAANRGIRAALTRLAQLVHEIERAPADDEAAVDVEFHVAGNLLELEHEGMRTGRWARSSRVQVVQYAVPVALEASSEDEIVDHLGRCLVDAVALAEEALLKKRKRLPVRQARDIADEVSRRLER